MPTRRKGETLKHYLPKAIKVLISEGRPQKQAIAIAHAMAGEKSKKKKRGK